MATYGGLQHLFEMPLPENPRFHDSWKHGGDDDDDHHHSFTEIFAQLYLKEHLDRDPLPELTSSSSSLFTLSPTSSLSSELSHEVHPTESSDEEESHARSQWRRSRGSYGGFPPPISCMGKSCLQPIRRNGRLILTEMRISTQEFLHACRENGRLKVHVVHSDEEDEDDGKLELHACRQNGRLELSINVQSEDVDVDGDEA
ncbi:uncharacterized protein LOC131000212 [Salvia miltiorrhiza]|uniref:uncharacterized protein LOC131000212 n=1 Tax=Salvia miltiorrhiza TaxID=226208 RepID=UPI0025AD3F54|nr:uncharacterized protein LOC131000212 [Salvia miltiorrhiza]